MTDQFRDLDGSNLPLVGLHEAGERWLIAWSKVNPGEEQTFFAIYECEAAPPDSIDLVAFHFFTGDAFVMAPLDAYAMAHTIHAVAIDRPEVVVFHPQLLDAVRDIMDNIDRWYPAQVQAFRTMLANQGAGMMQ